MHSFIPVVQIRRLSKGLCHMPKFSSRVRIWTGFLPDPKPAHPRSPTPLLPMASSPEGFLRRMGFLSCFSHKRLCDSADIWTVLLCFCWEITGAPVEVSDFWRTSNYFISQSSCKPQLEKLSLAPEQSEHEQHVQFPPQCLAHCSSKQQSLNEWITNGLNVHSHLWDCSTPR